MRVFIQIIVIACLAISIFASFQERPDASLKFLVYAILFRTFILSDELNDVKP
jgi:hypothetical protein